MTRVDDAELLVHTVLERYLETLKGVSALDVQKELDWGPIRMIDALSHEQSRDQRLHGSNVLYPAPRYLGQLVNDVRQILAALGVQQTGEEE